MAGEFPVDVEHALGVTEIPAEPERIVTVGMTEHDTVLALGLTPVGVTDWYGDQPFATWPWAQDELGEAEPEVLSNADGLRGSAGRGTWSSPTASPLGRSTSPAR